MKRSKMNPLRATAHYCELNALGQRRDREVQYPVIFSMGKKRPMMTGTSTERSRLCVDRHTASTTPRRTGFHSRRDHYGFSYVCGKKRPMMTGTSTERGRLCVVDRHTASTTPRRTGFHSRRDHSGNSHTDFLGDLPFRQLLHSGAAPYSPRFTLIGSENFHVKSRPNLFTHSRVSNVLMTVKSCVQSLTLSVLMPNIVEILHLGEPGSIPNVIAPGFSHVEIVADYVAGRRVFSGISRYSCYCIQCEHDTELAALKLRGGVVAPRKAKISLATPMC
ncbi:hypothetical protein PR048_005576 [Dryococelus australis]|uniref:Uncharacterized protein n=1 Tax=Dryococelus australis TaxID=614101 RepID=A0ABQ9I8I3_9NEOP|nr:hypothetical protein PR048_005576 [Dryococelus australis]